ncbi:MAG: MaoC/PaaZ C-terminal domain-containing protein [Promethearchaeota archaeon]
MKLKFEDLSEGMELPEMKKGPITRDQLVDYASASGDYNRIHYDEAFAQKAHLKGCIAHGMLVMAIIGSYLIENIENGKLKNFKIRFVGITNENDILSIRGKVVKKSQKEGENLITVDVSSTTQEGVLTTTGSAILAI